MHQNIHSNTLGHFFKHFAIIQTPSNFNQSITKTKNNAFKHQNIHSNTLGHFFKHLACIHKQVTNNNTHSNQLPKMKNQSCKSITQHEKSTIIVHIQVTKQQIIIFHTNHQPLYINQVSWRSSLTLRLDLK